MFGILSRVPVRRQTITARVLLILAGLSIVGAIIPMAEFTTTVETKSSGALWWKETTERQIPLTERRPYLFVAICLFVVAVLLVTSSIRLLTMKGSLKKYPPILVGVESMGVERIAKITNANVARVYRDVQAMIDSGMISDFYIDYQTEQVVSKKYVPERSHKTVVTCSGCGGNNELIVGITKVCSFCGQPLVLKTV